MIKEIIMLGAVILSPATLDPIILEMGAKYNIEPAWIKAHIKQESNWDVNASRFEAHKSDASWGLMQLLLATAREVLRNPELTITQLTQPRVNIEAGTKFLAQLWTRFGNMSDAIAAYNAGSPRLDKKTGKYVNQEYVDNVLKNYKTYKTLGTSVIAEAAINTRTVVESAISMPDAYTIAIIASLGVFGLVMVSSKD